MHFIFKLINLMQVEPEMVQIKGRNQFVGKWPADLAEKRRQAIAWLGRRYVNHPEYNEKLRGGFRLRIEEGQP